VPNCDNDLRLVQFTSGRLDGWMLVTLEVEIWRTVLLWMFLLSLFVTSLLPYFYTALDSGAVQIASAQVLTPSGDMSSGGGGYMCPGSAERLPGAVKFSCSTHGFVRLRTLNSCLIVSFTFLLLCMFMQPRGSGSNKGNNQMAWLHAMCSGPGIPASYNLLTMSL